MKRREFLIAGGAVVAAAAGSFAYLGGSFADENSVEGAFEITKTPEQWRTELTEAEFAVLREEDTERAYTSDLLKEKREGTYVCAGCALPLYASKTKFDSGTGWPSFYQAIDGAVGTKEDNSLFVTRTEVHCRRCGGHLGHIFNDGPPPTGKRHCINGVALDFEAA